MDVTLATHEVQVLGRPVRYQAAGRGAPVVLVHGLAGSTRWWRPTIPALAPHYRVYLVDLPGFGALGGRAHRFVLPAAADWLRAWLAAVDLTRVHLVGHSMGGYIAVGVAAGRPALVDRLVLVDTVALPPELALWRRVLPLAHEIRRLPLGFLPVLVADALHAGPPTLWRAARALQTADTRDRWAAITAPTLILWGARDRLVPPAHAHILRAGIPGARLLILPGAGHVPMVDQAGAFNAALRAFLGGAAVGE